MDENDISYKIRGAIYDVYNGLGAGLLESVYVAALECELLTLEHYHNLRAVFRYEKVPMLIL